MMVINEEKSEKILFTPTNEQPENISSLRDSPNRSFK